MIAAWMAAVTPQRDAAFHTEKELANKSDVFLLKYYIKKNNQINKILNQTFFLFCPYSSSEKKKKKKD